MAENISSPETLETREDLLPGDEGLWQYWDIQESIAEREERSWRMQATKIIKRYRDERSPQRYSQHLFNILWSNVQTLKPALYGRQPEPDCERRFKDEDDVGRIAAEILERTLKYAADNYGLDAALRAAVDDLLLPGRGGLRLLYVPHFADTEEKKGGDEENEEGESDLVAGEGDEGAPDTTDTASGAEPEEAAEEDTSGDAETPEPQREVVWEEVHFRYYAWEDYLEGPARQEAEVPWCRWRAFMTRAELRTRFGKEKADEANLDYTPKSVVHLRDDEPNVPPDAYKKCIVHETWDKSKRQVIWWAPGTPGLVLDQLDDPLRVRGFFPRPEPLLATTTTDRRIPVPDYVEYKDQAEELDVLSARIERLQRSLKVFGIYPGEEKETLAQLLSDNSENLLIPVADWQGVIDKGGMEQMIQWFPVKEVAEALIQLYTARDKAKQIIYEITGIADIIRGATAAEETATAQNLKSQFATLRLSDRQKMVARHARDAIRLAADIIGEHFSARTISMMTGYPQLMPVPATPAPPPMPPELVMAHAMAPTSTTMIGHNGGPPIEGSPQPAQDPHLAQLEQQYQQQMQVYQQQLQQLQAIQHENERREKQFEAAIALIKEDVHQNFRVDIEADSTIAVDENAEKQARVEFLEQMVPLLEQVIPIAQGVPPLAALAKEIVLFATRAFKAGRTLEEALEKAFDAIARMPPNPKAQGMQGGRGHGSSPEGEIAMAQAHEHDAQLEAQADMADSKNKLLVAMQANAIKARQVAEQGALGQQRLRMEAAKTAAELGLARDRAASEAELRAARGQSIAARGAAAGLT
jgi:hypothetical protein